MKRLIGILLIALALVAMNIGSSSTFNRMEIERDVVVGYGDDPFIDVQCITTCCLVPAISIENNLDYPIYVNLSWNICDHECWVDIGRIDPGHEKVIPIIPGRNYTVTATWDRGGANIRVNCPCHRRKKNED
ncbi:hypothetical protein PNA2_1188 [Pyrococcus sp. NA2]|uniref:hypothetical protein n=1 Tax=Pyrococcus sp. (strain NA2) TaxID=342949 RepID=UPI000209ABE3|nr:hypothetical protein [Pyrococcus sp. NA2]AEC52103.1 hypothetical protein PNA2_1188 [Pyrococcus sp. NA2]